MSLQMNSPATEKLVDDFEWLTKQAKFCPNRVWAIAGKNLHKLLPPRDKIQESVDCIEQLRKARRRHKNAVPSTESHWHMGVNDLNTDPNDHTMCTVKFCEQSVRDYTRVEQSHECEGKDCALMKGHFPRGILTKAAIEDRSTVWSLDGHSIIDRPRPHMAISHVWSDGTGAGQWPDGQVNECLYRYFKHIALQFQCEGIWWDTVCVPNEKAARSKAIKQIQNNYESARVTLVHDHFLRDWRWDRETACFAILMSPWFSRGWTALELAKSQKVKVMFRGSSGPVFKDLDEEILAKDGETGSLREASLIVQGLRKGIGSLDSLLKILRPRHTSWPRDLPTITALLANVQLPKIDRHQTIYRKILTDMHDPQISQGQLFHNSTTSEGSWYPTNLFDLPLLDNSNPEQNAEHYLHLENDLSLVGTWICIPAKEFPDQKIFDWKGTHPYYVEKLQLHLQRALKSFGDTSDHYRSSLLFETNKSARRDRALLVRRLSQKEQPGGLHCYEYIGALFFHETPAFNDSESYVKEVKMLGDAGPHTNTNYVDSAEDLNLQSVHDMIWKSDCKQLSRFIQQRLDLDMMLLARSSFKLSDHLKQGDLYKLSQAHRQSSPDHIKTRNSNCGDSTVPKTSGDALRMPVETIGRNSISGVDDDKFAQYFGIALREAIDIGDSDMFTDYRKTIFLDIPDELGQRPLHLAAERGNELVIAELFKMLPVRKELRRTVLNLECNLGQTALHRASWAGSAAIVKQLLHSGANAAVPDKDGNTALHLVIEQGFENLSLLLLSKTDVKISNLNLVTPLHLAAERGLQSIVEELLRRGADILARDKYGWSPLHYAAAGGKQEIVEILCEWQKDAVQSVEEKNDTEKTDEIVGWTPLHFAVINGHHDLALQLLDMGADHMADNRGWTPQHFAIMKALLTEDHTGTSTRYPRGVDWTPLHCVAISESIVLPKRLHEIDLKQQLFLPRRAFDRAFGVDLDLQGLLADPEAQSSINFDEKLQIGWSPLAWAAGEGHVSFMKLLLNVEDDSDIGDSRALTIAADAGNAAVVELLLSTGMFNEFEGDEVDEALVYAMRSGHKEVVEVLLEKTKNPTFDFRQALFHGVENEHMDVVKMLIEGGHVSTAECLTISTNAANKNRMTVINWLLASNRVTASQVLLSAIELDCMMVVTWLLETTKVDVPSCHATMMELASQPLHKGVLHLMDLLRENNDFGVNEWKWMLLKAAEHSHRSLVDRLLKWPVPGPWIESLLEWQDGWVTFDDERRKALRDILDDHDKLQTSVKVVVRILIEEHLVDINMCEVALKANCWKVCEELLRWMIKETENEDCKRILNSMAIIDPHTDFQPLLDWVENKFNSHDISLDMLLDNYFTTRGGRRVYTQVPAEELFLWPWYY